MLGISWQARINPKFRVMRSRCLLELSSLWEGMKITRWNFKLPSGWCTAWPSLIPSKSSLVFIYKYYFIQNGICMKRRSSLCSKLIQLVLSNIPSLLYSHQNSWLCVIRKNDHLSFHHWVSISCCYHKGFSSGWAAVSIPWMPSAKVFIYSSICSYYFIIRI